MIRELILGRTSTTGIFYHAMEYKFAYKHLHLRQEDILKDLGENYGFDYSIVRPMTIIGALKGNYLNLA